MSRWFDVARLRIRSLFSRKRVEDEMDRELRAHLELQVEENVARGMTAAAARSAAMRAFGGVEQYKEEVRDARGVSMIENLLRDLRYTLRGLLREPMLLIAAATSIALGVSGNLAVFTFARDFFLAVPDAREPEGLVQFEVSHGSHASYQRWLDLEASGALDHVAGYSIEKQINWSNGDATVSTTPLLVTANFFDVVGVPIVRGRAFSTDEARAERDPHVAVISHNFWERDLGGDANVIGRSLLLNGESYTILGVLPPRLRSVAGFSIAPPIYLPLNRAIAPELAKRDAWLVKLVGRLEPGQTIADGRAAIDAADRRLGRLEGDTLYAGVQEFTRLGAMSGKQARMVGAFFALLSLVSLFVLLIACANVAGLLIARGTSRRREIATRLAIGGTRGRLVQQFLVEGFWLSLLGTSVGLVMSIVFMRLVNGLTLPVAIPLELQLSPDMPVLLCALGLVILSMVFCALLPALGATRVALTPALKRDDGRHGRRRVTSRGVLLVGQVTVSAVLLVTGFLFVRNMMQAQLTDPGFDVEPVLVAQIGFVQGRPIDDHVRQLQQAVERVTALPGVERAAFTSSVPLTMNGGSHSGRSARIDDRPASEHIEYSQAEIGPGYFGTIGIRVLQGREFTPSDRAGAPPVVIVNEHFARKYIGDANAVGHRVKFTDDGAALDLEIVAVVANSKHRTIGEEQEAALYFPLLQGVERMTLGFVMVRARSDAPTPVASLRDAIAELDRSLAVSVEPMRSALAFALLPSRIGAVVLGGLGTLGLILAAFGLYAIVSYNVSRRFGEIAIRSALGATRGRIVRLVVSDASLLVGIGVVSGLAIAAAVTRVLTAFLVSELSPLDPLSFGGTAAAFAIVTVLASWIPTRYATRISPAIAMRSE
jgi:putative ABC transport system permease protein